MPQNQIHTGATSSLSQSRLEKQDQIKGILVLVPKPESGDNKSRSRLDAWDWRKFFLGLVSKPESKCQEFSVSSRWTRLNRRNSHSRLEIEKNTLADLWCRFCTVYLVRFSFMSWCTTCASWYDSVMLNLVQFFSYISWLLTCIIWYIFTNEEMAYYLHSLL